jgi:hypothetical protein
LKTRSRIATCTAPTEFRIKGLESVPGRSVGPRPEVWEDDRHDYVHVAGRRLGRHCPAAWGWSSADGIIDVILGLMIWQQWPASALWVIGLFVGINLLFRGFNWIALGLALHSLPRPQTA